MRGAEYAELAAFVAVAKEQNFGRASATLGVSRSALSHIIRSLEERLGARLLNRTTRSVGVTEAGQSLLDRIAPAFTEISEAVEGVSEFRERPSGTVRLNLSQFAAEVVLSPILGKFLRAYPDIRLELSISDTLTDIVAAGCDAGIRPGERVQKDMIAVRVSTDLRNAIVGSPGYFEARQKPRSPRDLTDHLCINYRFTETGGLYRWPFMKDGEHLDVAVEGPVTINHGGLMLTSALQGVGLACALETEDLANHLADGRLVRVLEDWCPFYTGLHLYYPSRRQMPLALRALIEFLKVKSP